MITVIGIFEDFELADEASSYLLANDFKSEDIDIHTSSKEATTEHVTGFFNHLFEDADTAAVHIEAGLKGTIVTVHAPSIREAQEAVDVMNNYGAMDVNIPGTAEVLSRIVERPVNKIFRLKNN